MPNRRGPNTYKGYLSPRTTGYPPCIRETVKKVYGSCRMQHPGEIQENKELCAKIAWAAAKKKCD